MSYRTFQDREGHDWEVVDRSSAHWELRPIRGNPEPPRRIRPPSYEADPFELSTEELQRLLDAVAGSEARRKPSPFEDD